MSKYNIKDVWEKRYKNATSVYDYSGRLMKKEAMYQTSSEYQPTLDHIRPLAKGGKDCLENIEVVNYKSNAEKADLWNHWKANNKHFRGIRVKGNKNAYAIEEVVD